MSDFKFGQLDEEEAESLNAFSNGQPSTIIQACIWFDMNMVMDDGMRKHLTAKCRALSDTAEVEARMMEAQNEREPGV